MCYSQTAKFYLGNPSNRPRTEKTVGHIMLQQEINLVQIPHPSKVTVKFPPPRGTTHSQMSGVCPNGRGDVEASISVVHYFTMLWPVFHFFFFPFLLSDRTGKRNRKDQGLDRPYHSTFLVLQQCLILWQFIQ